jgi:small subunit ribosomal protein S14
MAKTSKIVRNDQRRKLVEKYAVRRAELRKRSVDMKISLEERMEARAELGMLPRDSSKVRIRERCKITGRPRGYVSRLGISRVCVRRMAHEGVLPGLKKSSW